MKVLVATKETQGQRANDFSYADEGVIAIYGSMCDNARVDDKCGCARAMITPTNAKATTTIKVVDVDPSFYEKAKSQIIEHLTKNWGFSPSEAEVMANNEITETRRVASFFPTNSVLEIRGSKLVARTLG